MKSQNEGVEVPSTAQESVMIGRAIRKSAD